MLTKWFNNPNKKKEHTHINMASPVTQADWEKAKKHGISVFEYRKRCDIVKEKMANFKFKVGDEVYPSYEDWYKKMGKVRVLAVCHHYDQYGVARWDDVFPFLLQVQSIEKEEIVMDCSVEWVSATAPKEAQEC